MDKAIKLTVSSNGRDCKNDEFIKSKTWTRLQSRRVHQVDGYKVDEVTKHGEFVKKKKKKIGQNHKVSKINQSP